jgi:hypothetical protein
MISICDLSKENTYLPSMWQKNIMINIAMKTNGPAGINIFKFDSDHTCH